MITSVLSSKRLGVILNKSEKSKELYFLKSEYGKNTPKVLNTLPNAV